jgi:hypothetical protein
VHTFQLYKERQQALGVDMTQFKPPHINPADETVDFLVNPTVKIPQADELLNVR